MAGIRGMKWAKLNPWTKFWRVTVPNIMNDYRMKRLAETEKIHEGQRQILKGGVWIDSNNKIYNCVGNCVGEISFNEGYGVTR